MTAAAGVIAAGPLLLARPARAAKVSKVAAGYQDKPHDSQECDNCSHFIPGQTATAAGTCQLVEGSVSPMGWCVLYETRHP
jgi:hypothetical protein